VTASEPWLRVDQTRGTVERDRRVLVSASWDEVPIGAADGSVVVAAGEAKVVVRVPVLNPRAPRPDQLDGFVEANGHISIEAEHFTGARAPQGREWKRIPDHGRTLSGMTAWPVTATSSDLSPTGMRLEYRMYLFKEGAVTVHAHLAPTQKFQPGPGLRYAISFDDEPPRVVNVHADESLAAWERSVADGASVLATKHALAEPGYHTLKFWALEPGLVLQKLVVDTGGLRPSYLGPPESFFRVPQAPARPARR
jgi:hypothetical protein